MTKQQAPFRVDHVGSFLRPERLKEARAKFNDGEITVEELERVENEEIIALIEKEKELGLKSVTDGEFRRAFWHLDFLENLDGVELVEVDHFSVQFKDKDVKPKTLRIVGKVDFSEKHPFVKHFKFLKQFEDEDFIVKQTIPAPAQFYFELIRDAEHIEQTFSVYPSKEELFKDIIAAYRQVIKELYDAGCRLLQIDDCTWGVIVDDNFLKIVSKESHLTPSELSQ